MARNPDHLNHVNKHVHGPLILHVWAYVIASVIVIALVVYHVTTDRSGILIPFGSGVIGVILGASVTRIHKIFWDGDVRRVIYRLDLYGIIILILYILFEVFRERIVAYFVHGPVLTNASLALLAGVMMGRVLGMYNKISSVLKENL